jgi:rhodanese-related sulfurtransferase
MLTRTEISPTAVADLAQKEPIDLFDVRTPAEYAEVHAAAARSIPLDQIDAAKVAALRQTPLDRPIYVICRSGSRGKQACERLLAAGCKVVNVAGGTLAWEQAGLEVVRGQKTMSLERQVRIAVGALGVIGAILTVVNPWFALVPGVVGAGLICAGVTDTCAMGLFLARMPWNRKVSC